MKEINLGEFKRARIWINELPGVGYQSSNMVSHCVSVRNCGRTNIHAVAIELFIPLGARSMYGLVGGSFDPTEDDCLSVEISVSSASGRIFPGNLADLNDEVRVGLPAEYVRGIVAGVDAACARLSSVATGTFRVNCAAHGLVGSSEAAYFEIAFTLINLINCDGVDLLNHDLTGLFLS